MSSTYLTPYLYFTDNCRQAMTFYQNLFGGELNVMTYGDSAPADMPGLQADMVMHSSLMGGPVELLGSDVADSADRSAGNTQLMLHGEDAETLTGWFNRLAEAAQDVQPLKTEIWGDTYGEVTDRFGIHWLFNISAARE